MQHVPRSGLRPVDEVDLRARLDTLGLEQKAALLTGADIWHVPGCPEIGLAPMLLSDGPNGVRGLHFNDERDPALLLPNLAALAATWDPAALREAGEILGEEARRKGVHVLLGPTVNIQRVLDGGRNFENFSEDPLLTARLAIAYVDGVQSRGVAACVKHFVANDSETERSSYDVEVDERTLREVYLAPFEATVAAGVATVMSAYNAVRGQTMTENGPLNNVVLKGEWAFDGVVLSDWSAARTTEAAALGGLDLIMPGPVGPWGAALVAAVKEGRVPEETVDDKVLRILRLAARVGALDAATPNRTSAVPAPPAEVRPALRALTARSFVLLKNDGILPLHPERLRRVALIGPAAVAPAHQGGGSASLNAATLSRPVEALRTALPAGTELTVHRGTRSRINLEPLAAEATLDPVTGRPGGQLEFLDDTGRVLLTQHRRSYSLSWIGFPGSPALPPGTAALRLRTVLKAPSPGRHTFSLSGTGRLRLTFDGQVVLSAESASRGGVEDMLRPPTDQRVDVDLDGTDVAVELFLDVDLGDAEVEFAALTLGHELNPLTDDEEFAAAVQAAREADVVVLMVGTSDEVESETFDRPTLSLYGRQDELARAVIDANPNTVVAVNASSPVLMPWADDAKTLLWTFFGGQEYGHAVADVLLGHAEPAGRLTMTFPRAAEDAPVPDAVPVDGHLAYPEGLLVGYRGYDAAGMAPLYPFGHGLGYTSWEFVSATVAEDARTASARGEDILVTVRIRNVGERRGRQVVQAYADRADGDERAPMRQLAGFATVELDAGAEADVEVRITARALSRHTGAGWGLPDARRVLRIGPSSRELSLTVSC
ncbi:glycoside hydrolase family 3 C-terminal domain-containing protein [Streptomyces sp. NPDC051001]|uniref:beta-glucosidase family protein n=1 Tax=Streptomyces sp. NPDC051001 TaxID=3155795 RepID=UPI00342E80CC